MRPVLVLLVSLWVVAGANGGQARRASFLAGVDANYAPEMAERGAVWKPGRTLMDLLRELHRNGADAFRVRVWTRDDGPSGLTYATKLAAMAQRAGLRPYLALFLSEDWSDLVKQPEPSAWGSLTLEQKLVEVRRYAEETVRHFDAAGVKVDLFEIGNEIDFGLCGVFEESWANRASTQFMGARIWPREARIVRAAEEGILAANPRARFILHLAQWWAPEYVIAFHSAMKRGSVQVDYIGLTYYPSSGLGHDNGLADFDAIVRRIHAGCDVPVIVCEYAYPSLPRFAGMFAMWNRPVDGYPLTEAGQSRWVADFLSHCRKHPDIRGAFYWSPEWSSPEMWTAFALYRPDGSAKPGLASLGRSVAARDGNDGRAW